MRDQIERYGVQFSNYGSEGKSGPTIAMALITMYHYDYQDIEMFRLGAMAPMYSFLTAKNDHLAISKDHRAFYDIMRRLNGLLKLDIDLSELKAMGDAESERLRQLLEKIAASNTHSQGDDRKGKGRLQVHTLYGTRRTGPRVGPGAGRHHQEHAQGPGAAVRGVPTVQGAGDFKPH